MCQEDCDGSNFWMNEPQEEDHRHRWSAWLWNVASESQCAVLQSCPCHAGPACVVLHAAGWEATLPLSMLVRSYPNQPQDAVAGKNMQGALAWAGLVATLAPFCLSLGAAESWAVNAATLYHFEAGLHSLWGPGPKNWPLSFCNGLESAFRLSGADATSLSLLPGAWVNCLNACSPWVFIRFISG